MKKLLSILLLAAVMFAVSCNNDTDEVETSTLQVIKPAVELTAAGGEARIEVIADQPVTAESNQPWCHIVNIVNNEVIVSLDTNPDMLSRTAIVYIASGDKKTKSLVSQAGVILDFGFSTMTVSAFAGVTDFQMATANSTDMSATTTASWCTLSVVDGKIRVTVTEDNETGSARTVPVNVRIGSSMTKTVNLTQSKPGLTSNKTTLSFPKGGGESSVTLDLTNARNTAVNEAILPAWISYRQDGNIFYFTAEPNNGTSNRISTIEFTASPSLTMNLTVVQPYRVLNTFWNTTSTSWYFTYAASSPVYQNWLIGIDEDMRAYGGSYLLYRLCFVGYTDNDNTHSLRSYLANNAFGSGYFQNTVVADSDTDITIVKRSSGTMYDNNGGLFLNTYPEPTGYYGFVMYINKKVYTLTEDYLDPTRITFTEADNPDNWFTLTTTPTAPF